MRIFYLLILLFCQSANCQEYQFNYMVQYSAVVGSKIDRTVYSNSANPNVILMIGGFNGSSFASITDYTKGMYYEFKVKEKKVNDEIIYNFKFKNKNKIQVPPSSYTNHDFKFEELESDSIFKKVKLTVYSDSSRKDVVTTQTLTMKKSESNLFTSYRFACLHPFESLRKLVYPGNYMVISSTGITRGGYKINTKLITGKPTQLAVIIP